MNKIDISGWKEFRVGDIFEVKKPPVYHTRQVVEQEDGLPYIVRSKYNNGVKFRACIKDDEKNNGINPPHVISFGSENSSFFYQKEGWISGRDMYYIDTSRIPEKACLFLITCLEKITHKYDYSFGLFPELLKKERIKLPVTSDGIPDYKYMERYMEEVEEKVGKKLNIIKKILFL